MAQGVALWLKMGIYERFGVPVSPLAKRLLADLKERFPWSSKAALAGHALELGLVEMTERPYVASGAPVVEWRRAG